MRKYWNTMRFRKGDRRNHALQTFWAKERVAKFDLKIGPIVEF